MKKLVLRKINIGKYRTKAFTLLESMIGVGISVLVVGVMFQFLTHTIRSTKQNNMVLDELVQIRTALRAIDKDMSQIREWDSSGESAVVSEKVSFKKIAPGEITFITNFGQLVTFKEVVKNGRKFFTRRVRKADLIDLSFIDQVREKVKNLGKDLKNLAKDTTKDIQKLAMNKITRVIGSDGNMLKTVFNKVKFGKDDAKLVLNQALSGGGLKPEALLQSKVTDAVKDLKYFINGSKGASEGSFVHDMADIVKNNTDKIAKQIMSIRNETQSGIDGVKADVNNLMQTDQIAEHVSGVLLNKFFEKLDKEFLNVNMNDVTSRKEYKINFKVVMKEGNKTKIIDLNKIDVSGLSKERLKKVFGFKVSVPLDNLKKKLDNKLSRIGALPEKIAINILPKGLKKAYFTNLDKWKKNPIASIRTGLVQAVQKKLDVAQYQGLVPEVKDLFRDGVEVPDLWILDMFNTPALFQKLKSGLNVSAYSN
ncbi:type II secretion system protein J [Candidatus Riflebacteria bacterium]